MRGDWKDKDDGFVHMVMASSDIIGVCGGVFGERHRPVRAFLDEEDAYNLMCECQIKLCRVEELIDQYNRGDFSRKMLITFINELHFPDVGYSPRRDKKTGISYHYKSAPISKPDTGAFWRVTRLLK